MIRIKLPEFVRVGSDGYVGIFDTFGNQNLEVLRKTANYKNITVLQTPVDPNLYGIELTDQNGVNVGINGDPTSGSDANLTVINGFLYVNNFTNISKFHNLITAMNGISFMSGSPDLRIGVTAADASPITIFSSTVASTRYEVKARILATAGSSATYKIVWTEGGVAQSVSLTVTAADTEVHDNFVIAPDADTNITAQITAITSSTVNVNAIVSVLG